MPAIDVYQTRKAMEARQDTWGHLAPKPRKKYAGTILFAISNYAGQGGCIITSDFPGLGSSPWFYDAMCEHVGNLANDEAREEGHVYRWTGTYQFFTGSRKKGGRDRYLDESSYKFEGTVARVALS